MFNTQEDCASQTMYEETEGVTACDLVNLCLLQEHDLKKKSHLATRMEVAITEWKIKIVMTYLYTIFRDSFQQQSAEQLHCDVKPIQSIYHCSLEGYSLGII